MSVGEGDGLFKSAKIHALRLERRPTIKRLEVTGGELVLQQNLHNDLQKDSDSRRQGGEGEEPR